MSQVLQTSSRWLRRLFVVSFGATVLATGCDPGGVPACPSGFGTLAFENHATEAVTVSVANDAGASADLSIGAQGMRDETRPPGDYSVTATGAASGRVLLDQVYAVRCDVRTPVIVEPLPRFSLSVEVSGGGRVTSTPQGIDCGSPGCSADFDVDTQVVLSAASDAGSRFDGWTGDCSGTADCTLTLDRARSVGAQFGVVSDPFAVTLSGTGEGSVSSQPAGIDCSNTPDSPAACSTNFNRGTIVTLTATASVGSEFVGWTGDCAGSALTCETTVAGSTNVDAQFARSQFALAVTLAGPGSGVVTSAPAGISCGSACSATFGYGEVVELTASPDPGAKFLSWSGACTGASNPCVVTVDQARTVEATFEVILLTAPLVSSIAQGERAQGQVQALGLNHYIATTGVFPSSGSVNSSGTPFVGQIMQFAGGFAPGGWKLCDGALLQIASYTALFAVIGTTYGGNGTTTFAVPDLRARAPMGMGTLTGATAVSTGPGTSVVPLISSIGWGTSSQGQVHALGVNYLIATAGAFPPRTGGITSTNNYLGQIMVFAGTFAPGGWAFCDGAVLDISANSALYSLLGTMYGGDGLTTFALPDLRGRLALGRGSLTSPTVPPSSPTQIPLILSIAQGEASDGQAGVLGLTYAIATEGIFPSPTASITSAGPYYAQLLLFAGDFAPGGWAELDGALRDISGNEALFSLIGTVYGGDGVSTMAVPDLRARVAMGPGNR